ncbi:MAG TPA: hypothetical protein VE422_11580 [Terriglobia bacterium]|nr:hypothetical protein [Terriglobia bacterium]
MRLKNPVEARPAFFHKLYGRQKPRVTYYERDFIDYVLMILLSALVVGVSYGFGSVVSIAGLALCAFALAMFIVRHGIEFRVPLILRRPQDALFMFVHKLQNLRPMYFIALGLLLLENLLIAATPGLPHHVELMRKVALGLFYTHLISITLFRTAILAAHLAKKEFVREVLIQTPWKRVINEKTNIALEILHAYCTGLLAHVLLIAPWYLVITHSDFSVLFFPIVCLINVVVHLRWMRAYNAWFYRDHWVGHNSEFEFIFLHGAHHDAIPSALIAVADSGFLEGFMRFAISSPVAFYNPVISFLIYMFDVKSDIEMHQYIPGVFPRLSRRVLEVFQHSTHHYGRLEPYGLAMKLDQPGISEDYKKRFARLPDSMTNSFKLEEELTGFQWNNPTHLSILSLWDKYQKRRATA